MNFNEYVSNDIEEKKVLIGLLPHNTKVKRTKYLETVDELLNKYNKLLESTKRFIEYKYNKLLPVKENKDAVYLDKDLSRISDILLWNNNLTSYFEKIGFDKLFYDIMHYYDNTIRDNNIIIDKFIKIFSDAGINLSGKDFDINMYSRIYMDIFFSVRPNYDDSNFQNIFWKCPKVIEYIIINLRMLIKKHELKLKLYVSKTSKNKLKDNNFNSCLEAYEAYRTLIGSYNLLGDETEYDIVHLCMDGAMFPSALLKNDDTIKEVFSYFWINEFDIKDSSLSNSFLNSIVKLKDNFNEYHLYTNYLPIINSLIAKYKKEIVNPSKEKKAKEDDLLKLKMSEINKLSHDASKYNVKKKYYSFNTFLNDLSNSEKEKLFQQQLVLDKLYKAYSDYNALYFEEVLKKNLKLHTTGSDMYHLIISYPFFVRKIIKKAMDYTETEEVDNALKDIHDLYYSPNRKVLDMICVFINQNIIQELMNGYRFENLNIHEDSFDDANYPLILEKCKILSRKLKYDTFKLNIDEISFLCDVFKLINDGKM